MSHFAQLVDKSLPADVELVAWCPIMDLLALVTDDGQLHVHRLNWQRLWTLGSFAHKATALCWSPDATELAVGFSDGSVTLVTVEKGKAVHTSKAHQRPVAQMAWVNVAFADKNSKYEYRRMKFFDTAGLADGSPSQAKANKQLPTGSAARFNPQSLTLLVSLDDMGTCALQALGRYSLATVSLGLSDGEAVETRRQEQPQVLLSSDASKLLAVTVRRRGRERKGPVTLALCSTGALKELGPEVLHLATGAFDTAAYISIFEQALDRAAKIWKTARDSFDSKIQQLEAAMETDDSFGSTPMEEFLLLLASCTISPALQQFLDSTMAEMQLKALARSIDNALYQVHGLLVEGCGLLETAAFTLGELCGLADSQVMQGVLGLHAEQLRAMQHAVLLLMLRLEFLRRTLCRLCAAYRQFFGWLLRMARLVAAPDAATQPEQELPVAAFSQQILAFLQTHLETDRLSQELCSGAQHSPAVAWPCDSDVEVTEGGAAAAANGIPPPHLTHILRELWGPEAAQQLQEGSTVRQQLTQLKARSSQLLHRSPGSLAQKLGPVQEMLLADADTPCSHISLSQERGDASSMLITFATQLPAPRSADAQMNAIAVLQLRSADSDEGAACGAAPRREALFGRAEGCLLLLPEGMHITALQQYTHNKDKSLLLTYEQRSTAGRPLAAPLVPSGGEGEEPWCTVVLSVLAFAGLPLQPLPDPGCRSAPFVQQCREMNSVRALAPEELHARSRSFPTRARQAGADSEHPPPLAVSCGRGLASLCVGIQRVVILDLEEEEDDAEEEADGSAGEADGSLPDDAEDGGLAAPPVAPYSYSPTRGAVNSPDGLDVPVETSDDMDTLPE